MVRDVQSCPKFSKIMNNYTVLVSPFLLGGQLSVQNFEKLAGLWFTRGITTQVDTMKDYLEVQKNLQGCVLLGGVKTQVDTMKDYLEVQKSLLGCGLLGGSVPRLTL